MFLALIHVAASAQSVGDISFDPKKDDPGFRLCNEQWVWQGYELKTKVDETPLMVERELRSAFKTQPQWSDQNAIVRIRFVVNCKGASDRFRTLALDSQLKQTALDPALESHLIDIARKISWPVRRAQSQTVDYYHHFSVRISDGKLTDVIQ